MEPSTVGGVDQLLYRLSTLSRSDASRKRCSHRSIPRSFPAFSPLNPSLPPLPIIILIPMPNNILRLSVIDLETAVKDGILGGAVVGGGLVTAEKLDLKKMIEELDSVDDIPTVFICPISLEPMVDPKTLCTRQTYKRSNILKCFSMGCLTYPNMMQELWDDAVTPNKTLHQLIHTWFSQRYLLMKKRSEDVQGWAAELLNTLGTVKGQARVQTLKELLRVVSTHASARKMVVDSTRVGLISSLLGPFTSHVVIPWVYRIFIGELYDHFCRS